MTLIRWAGSILLAFTFGSGILAYASAPAACGTSLTAGFTVVNVRNQPGGSNYSANPPQATLKMGIWYPSLAAASSYTYASDISGLVAKDAVMADCGSGVRFPLLVFSHGWSGCGTQSVFLTEELARRGYIVAAPDHADHGCSVDGGPKQSFQDVNTDFPIQKFGDPSVWTDQTGNYRNVDIKTVTDWLLATSPWKDRINAAQIGMSGHSFGGYTSFAKIGGWASWLDPRFKAGIMYSPFIQAFESQAPSTVPNATVPQMFQGGTTDIGITPWVKGPQPCPKQQTNCTPQPGAFQQAQFPKYFAELGTADATGSSGGSTGGSRLGGGRVGRGGSGGSGGSGNSAGLDASHFAFSNMICGGSSTSPTTVQACLTNIENAQLIVNYSQYFLDHYLQGQNSPQLWSTGSGWDTYWRTGGVPAGTNLPGLPAARLGLASLKGENLAPQTASVPGQALMPQQIDGVTVTLTPETSRTAGGILGGGGRGGRGGISASRIGGGIGGGARGTTMTYPAYLYSISPTRIDFVVPSETPAGTYTATASLNGTEIAAGPLSVQDVSPALLSFPPGLGQSGPGFAMGSAQTGNNTTSLYNSATSAPIPVTVTPGSTYLSLEATGMYFATNLTATIGGIQVGAAVAPSSSMGIELVNIGPLPALKGQTNIVISAAGMQSHPVAVVLQ